MTSVSNGTLPVAPAPRIAHSRIPVLGEILDARSETAFQAAFDRSERVVIETMAAHGETLVYVHPFARSPQAAHRNISLSVGLPATLGATGLAAMALGAPSLVAGTSLGAAAAAVCISLARAGWPAGALPHAGARLAAICTRSIILATPARRGAGVRRIPLEAIRGVAREPRGAVIRLSGEEIVFDGLAQPGRFVDEARRCIDEDALRVREADAATPVPDDDAAMEREACEVAAIRRRLRERGWMLAVANDYRLSGEWHVFYSFTHPDGIAAKGEGTSDLAALRLAEADVVATETWLRGLKEKAA